MYGWNRRQTPDYARALISEADADADAKLIERWVEIRFMRQTALTRAEPVKLSMIVGKGALRRTVGGRKVRPPCYGTSPTKPDAPTSTSASYHSIPAPTPARTALSA